MSTATARHAPAPCRVRPWPPSSSTASSSEAPSASIVGQAAHAATGSASPRRPSRSKKTPPFSSIRMKAANSRPVILVRDRCRWRASAKAAFAARIRPSGPIDTAITPLFAMARPIRPVISSIARLSMSSRSIGASRHSRYSSAVPARATFTPNWRSSFGNRVDLRAAIAPGRIGLRRPAIHGWPHPRPDPAALSVRQRPW